MADDPTELPTAVVLAWAVYKSRAVGTDGEEHPVVVVSFQFQHAPGMVAQQSFVLHADDARDLRKGLKHPPTFSPTPTDTEETTTND